MTPLAHLLVTVVGILAFVTLCYASLCAGSPWRRCRHCDGTGRVGRRSRHDCRTCDGTGIRLRAGRHLWNYLTRIYHDGTRDRRPR